MDLVDGEGRDGEGLEGAGVAAMHPLHLVLVHVLQVQHQAPRRARPSKFTLSSRGLYITSKIIFPPPFSESYFSPWADKKAENTDKILEVLFI